MCRVSALIVKWALRIVYDMLVLCFFGPEGVKSEMLEE